MPLQNRIDPEGRICRTPARGTMMGNRGGRLHDAARNLTARRWATRQWICCVLDFKGRRRQVMGAGYTEMFFLDEVTALAAGHRPCFECRRSAATAFAARFPGAARAPEMDRHLHAERLGPRDRAMGSALPDGAMFLWEGVPHARRGGLALPWSFTGYGLPRPLPEGPLDVLTPRSIRTVLSAGYAPLWHPSAGEDSGVARA